MPPIAVAVGHSEAPLAIRFQEDVAVRINPFTSNVSRGNIVPIPMLPPKYDVPEIEAVPETESLAVGVVVPIPTLPELRFQMLLEPEPQTMEEAPAMFASMYFRLAKSEPF
jgi:hypothetical protein